MLNDLRGHLAKDGFYLSDPKLDGNIVRFDRNNRKNNAWFIGFLNHTVKGGQPYVVAIYGDWADNEGTRKYCSIKLSKVDQEACEKQLKEASEKHKREKIARQEDAARRALENWELAEERGTTSYLARKGIEKPYGIRFKDFDTILVPLRDINDKLWSIQYILEDGQKRFLRESKIDENFFLIGNEPKEKLLVCEGFATGVTLHRATGLPVACAFSAQNLGAVAKKWREKSQDLIIVICGDNDRFTDGNPGSSKASAAASMVSGAVVIPDFGDESDGTDFNDLEMKFGIDAVQKYFEDEPEVTEGLKPLGYDDGVYYFWDYRSRDIVKITSFAKSQFLQVAPLEYWSNRYPSKSEGVNWTQATNDLIDMSRKIGVFDPNRIRGGGVWLDEGRVVVNTGRELIVDHKKQSMSGTKSRYFWIQTPFKICDMAPRANLNDTKILIDVCSNLNWVDPKSGYLLAGWLAIARIAGALSIRPHIWLTGGSGTGKTTVMDRIIDPCLGYPKGKVHAQGASTEAGIRQTLKSSAVPVIFDEFETTGEHSKYRIASILELLRVSWSNHSGAIVKGSAGGSASTYTASFPALLSSIRVNLDNDADRSRYSVLELAPHTNDQKQWERLQDLISNIDEDFGEKIFSRSVFHIRNIIENQKIFGKKLSAEISQRFGQQVGTLLAGLYSLMSDEPITEKIAENLLKELDFTSDRQESETTDQAECLLHLLTHKFTFHDGSGTIDTTIMNLANNPMLITTAHIRGLSLYGLELDSDLELFIPNDNAELRRIYRMTRWDNAWTRSIRRLKFFKKSFKKGQNGITVSLKSFLEKK